MLDEHVQCYDTQSEAQQLRQSRRPVHYACALFCLSIGNIAHALEHCSYAGTLFMRDQVQITSFLAQRCAV